ncbi:hypothetical protein DL766_001413 [Monosporascus sp. MC13-8B]|nr:hypothetical protein DL766_001413 [Monosporascus sp. MC13-8B]
MYFKLAVFAASVLASAAAGKPVDVVAPIAPPHDVNVAIVPRRPSSLMKRDANATFDLGFQIQNQVLFDGPALNLNVPLTLECVDCRAWGSVTAVTFIPDDIGDFLEDLTDFDLFNNANLSLVFNGVGALIDLSVVATEGFEFTLPLFASQTPLGVAGPNFQLGAVFFIELVMGITGKVEASSGFQLLIPDGSAFTMPLDPTLPNTAAFDGTTLSLLPLEVEAPANLTVALRLRVQAGLEFVGSPLLSATALAGAFLDIPEVVLGARFSFGGANESESESCQLPAFAEVNVNAGVFVEVGADVGNVGVVDLNPSLETTFFRAAVETCFLGGTAAGDVATTAKPTASSSSAPYVLMPSVTATATPGPSTSVTTTTPPQETACHTALVTETTTVVATRATTACAVPAVHCPANMTRVGMAEQTETITTSRCPEATPDLHALTTIVTTVTTTACPRVELPASGLVSLTKLSNPITSSVVVDPAATTLPSPAVTGSARR